MGNPCRDTDEGPERIATYHAEYLRGAIIASCARSDANNPYGIIANRLGRVAT